MQLYTFFRSSTSFRLRIALGYKGIAYEPRFVSLPKMEHQAADYLAKNPQGLVPAMVDEAGRVFQPAGEPVIVNENELAGEKNRVGKFYRDLIDQLG